MNSVHVSSFTSLSNSLSLSLSAQNDSAMADIIPIITETKTSLNLPVYYKVTTEQKWAAYR